MPSISFNSKQDIQTFQQKNYIDPISDHLLSNWSATDCCDRPDRFIVSKVKKIDVIHLYYIYSL